MKRKKKKKLTSEDNGRRRPGQRQRPSRRGTRQRHRGIDRRQRRHDLRRPHPEDELLHRPQPLERELEPDVEQQEDDAELRQVPHAFDVADDAERVRPDERAPDEEA